jgi:hypothetical protein
MDYPGSEAELTCTQDLRNVKELIELCKIHELQTMDDSNGALMKGAVMEKMQAMLQGMKSGDTFVFYYSGHGMQIDPEDREDGGTDGDEQHDEAFCFQDESGEAGDPSACWIDDQVAVFFRNNLPQGVNLLIIADCCHSDSICDFESHADLWAGISAVSISGCKDGQTSGDVGGGVLTHSLLLTMQKIREGMDSGDLANSPLNVAWVFETTVKTKQKVFADQEQVLSHETSADYTPMVWPLIPRDKYVSPMGGQGRRVQQHIADQTTDEAEDAKNFYSEDLAGDADEEYAYS